MRCRKLLRRRLLLFVCVVFAVYISGTMIKTSHYSRFTHKLNASMCNFIGDLFTVQWNPPDFVRPPHRRVFNVSCSAIIAGDENEMMEAKSLMECYNRTGMSDEDIVNFISDCDDYKRTRGYLSHSVTEEERAFPIAFSILLYKEVEQAERLLQIMYRPHNFYCIHVDANSPTATHKAVDKLAACFDNVFVVSRKEYIVYAGFTRLQADLNSMHDLLRYKSWKYFINLPSQEFPLKTNLEMVKILKIYNGSNDIEGTTGKRMVAGRYDYRYKYKHVSQGPKLQIYKTNETKYDTLPYNMSLAKGSAYGVFSRAFVEFVLENRIAREFLDWCRDVYSPDEYYWATLHHNPQIGTPGAFEGKPDDKPFLAVYANWEEAEPCDGKSVRGVCVFGVGDLQHLVHRKEFFANKFYQELQPLALDCMEEWMYNKTAKHEDFNTSYYETLPFVRGQ